MFGLVEDPALAQLNAHGPKIVRRDNPDWSARTLTLRHQVFFDVEISHQHAPAKW